MNVKASPSIGAGVVYNFDAVGSYSPSKYYADGRGASLGLPILDSWIIRENEKSNSEAVALTVEETVQLAHDALKSVTQREISTGDYAEIVTLKSEQFDLKRLPLRQD